MERHGLIGRAEDIFFVAPPLCVTRGEVDFTSASSTPSSASCKPTCSPGERA
jgi:hypothetical protein